MIYGPLSLNERLVGMDAHEQSRQRDALDGRLLGPMRYASASSGSGPRHSSKEFLLSIQFIGQLGLRRRVLWRVFSQRHDYRSEKEVELSYLSQARLKRHT